VIYPAKPPILPELSRTALEEFVRRAVDPLPQALVLTAVVIGMAVNILIAFAIIQIYRIYGTLDVREVGKLLPALLRRDEA
jgi:multicomponent Na+:H+ antiporter subunit C